MIFAVDPGNVQSAYVIVDDDLWPVEFGKIDNHDLLAKVAVTSEYGDGAGVYFVIEMVANMGMPAVGETLFETAFWIGRFYEAAYGFEKRNKIYRKDEKMNLCGSMKAKDANIKQALIDRFAKDTKNYGKGTKANHGWFYGFREDIWQAYAVAVTYHDLKR